MYAKDMTSSQVIEIIREIIGWEEPLNDYNKHFTIKSFLLGWTSAEAVHQITESNKRR